MGKCSVCQKVTKQCFLSQSDSGLKSELRKFVNFIEKSNPSGGKHSIAILDALNEAFFQDMGFRGNTANYYNPANSFIDKVLENRQGIPFFPLLSH